MTGPEITVGGGAPGAPAASNAGNGHVGESLLDSLREAAKAQAADHFEDFPVGGEFKKQLWIRYRPMDEGPMNRFIARRSAIKDNPELTKEFPITELNMDLMAQSCVCVLGADPNGENREELRDQYGVVRLEHRLLELLNMVPPDLQEGQATSHEVIMMLFGRNAMAVVDHGDDVVKWMQDPTVKPSVGNS